MSLLVFRSRACLFILDPRYTVSGGTALVAECSKLSHWRIVAAIPWALGAMDTTVHGMLFCPSREIPLDTMRDLGTLARLDHLGSRVSACCILLAIAMEIELALGYHRRAGNAGRVLSMSQPNRFSNPASTSPWHASPRPIGTLVTKL